MMKEGCDLLGLFNSMSRTTNERTDFRQVRHVKVCGDVDLVTKYKIRAPAPALISGAARAFVALGTPVRR